MADYIDKQIEVFTEIEKVFENSRVELKEVEKTLNLDITAILDNFSGLYDLKAESDTSVNPVKYYAVKSRVKSVHSLREKLIRKDLGLKISNKFSLNITTFHQNYANVKEELFKIDDIIGARVVTELKADCQKVYKLIQDYNGHFIGRKIVFDTTELKNQPEKMKNGLPIYRIKGIYKNQYGFELQIKSKIDEAWGEMDHSIFYKDYSVSPIKNTVQITMNNVGELLDKIEDLLLGLRNSEKHFKEKKEEIDFLKELTDDVFDAVKNKLGDNYELGKIASLLKVIRDKTKVKKGKRKLDKITTDFINYKVDSDLLKNYVLHRKNSFELLVAESLYVNWYNNVNSEGKIVSQNYSNNLQKYIKILAEHLVIKSQEIDENKFSLNLEFVLNVFNNLSDYPVKKSIFIYFDLMTELKIIELTLKEVLFEYFEDIDSSESSIIIDLIISFYSKVHLNYLEIHEIEIINDKVAEVNFDKGLKEIVFDIGKSNKGKIDEFKLNDQSEDYEKLKFLIKLNELVIAKLK